jgi:TIR domain
MRDLSSPDESGGHVSDSVSAPKLFISYRRDETPVSAAWLYEVLVERFGEPNVFMDLKLKPGENFVKRISEVVGSCHILLLVMGPRWADPEDGEGAASIKDPDDFVRLEAEIAMARDDVQVLPVLVGGAKMPHPDELPEQLRELTQIHAKQLTNERRAEDMKELVGRVDELLPPETFVHVPDSPPPPPLQKMPEAKRDREPRWRLVAAIAAGVALIALAVVLSGALGGDGGGSDESGESGQLGVSNDAEYQVDADVFEVDARGSLIALTTRHSEGELLGRVDPAGGIDNLVSKPWNYNGIDVGTNGRGNPTVVASRCDGELCDVYALKDDRLVSKHFARGTCGATRPSMFDGTVLFYRGGRGCQEKALFLKRGDEKEPERIAGSTQGADLNGNVAAALLSSGALEVFKVDAIDDSSRLLAEGKHSLGPPVTVDGDYVYLTDQEGSSYSIVRFDHTAAEPVLERYAPHGRALPEASAPSFGVSSEELYVEGLDGVIYRDDDPDFEDEAGPLRKL